VHLGDLTRSLPTHADDVHEIRVVSVDVCEVRHVMGVPDGDELLSYTRNRRCDAFVVIHDTYPD
jgi:hypothetical protein